MENRWPWYMTEPPGKPGIALYCSGRQGPTPAPRSCFRLHGLGGACWLHQQVLRQVVARQAQATCGDQNRSVPKRSTQNHVGIKKAEIRSSLWLGLSLTYLHLPGF